MTYKRTKQTSKSSTTRKIIGSRQKSTGSQGNTIQCTHKCRRIKNRQSKRKINKYMRVYRHANRGGNSYVKKCRAHQNLRIVTGHGHTLDPKHGFYIPLETNIITVTALGGKPFFFSQLGYIDNRLHDEILRLYSTQPTKVNGICKSRTLFENNDKSCQLTQIGTDLQTSLNKIPDVRIQFKNHLPWPYEILKKRSSTRTRLLQHLKDFKQSPENIQQNMAQLAYFFPNAQNADSYKKVLVRDHIQVLDGILKGLKTKKYNSKKIIILGPLVHRSDTYRYPVRLKDEIHTDMWIKPENINILTKVSLKGLPQNEYNGKTVQIKGLYVNGCVVQLEDTPFPVDLTNVVFPPENPVVINAVEIDKSGLQTDHFVLEDQIVLLDEMKYATRFNNSRISFLPESKVTNSECLITCVDTNNPTDFSKDKDIHTQHPTVLTTIDYIISVEGKGTYIIIACRPLEHLTSKETKLLRQRSDS